MYFTLHTHLLASFPLCAMKTVTQLLLFTIYFCSTFILLSTEVNICGLLFCDPKLCACAKLQTNPTTLFLYPCLAYDNSAPK